MKRKRDDTRAAATAAKSAKATPSGEVKLKIQRFGPSPEQLQALAPRLNAHPAIKKALTKTRHRLLGIALVDAVEEARATGWQRPNPTGRFPRGDVWILRYRGTEIDDGVAAVGPPYEAGIDTWVNGEAINGADVVVWYGAHFTHNIAGEPPGHFGHIVGPDLKRVRW